MPSSVPRAAPLRPPTASSGESPAPKRGFSLPHQPRVAIPPLFLFTVVLAWWAWERGGYFDVKFLPGALVLLGLLVALLLFAPWPASTRGLALVPPAALAALAVWTLISGLWSPSPNVAVTDAQRALIYGVAFVLGLWACLLLGRRMLLSLLPLALAGAVVGLITLIALWVGSDAAEFFEDDATLRFPLGYRNANAAFFLMAAAPLGVLAAARDLDWRLRGFLLGSTTLVLELAILAQSRTSIFAAVVALVVLLAAHPARIRLGIWLAVATVPAVLALPWLLEVFQHDGSNTAASLDPLRPACTAMAATSVASTVLGCLLARRDPAFGWRLRPTIARRAAAIALVVAVVVLASADGGPTGWFDRQLDELTAGSPDLSTEESRFGFDFRSERGDIWRVAREDFVQRPLLGEGAGGFRFSYLRDRESSIQPEDPHSVELLMAAELGIPGVLLFGAFLVASVVAVLRSRRLGPSAAAVAAVGLAMAAYWLVHASVEWFWSYPAITLAPMFALGAAAAPGALRPGAVLPHGVRRGLAAACALVALVSLPGFLSERYTDDALSGWQQDLTGAYDDLEQAADLSPWAVRPLVTEAVIAEEAGEPQRALAALGRAQERVPDEWTLYYLQARLLAQFDPAGAARALARARELNPRGEEIPELESELAQP